MQCDVGVIQVNPECHALGHLSPSLLIGPDTRSTFLVELGHAKLFDGFVAHQIEALLHFDLHGQSVGVPATFSLDEVAFHRLPAADQILVGSS